MVVSDRLSVAEATLPPRAREKSGAARDLSDGAAQLDDGQMPATRDVAHPELEAITW
jgi:hypothetical protein